MTGRWTFFIRNAPRLQAEAILFLRTLHTLFVKLLPGLSPRAPVEIRHGVFECRSRRERRGGALHGKVLLNAIQIRIRLSLVELTRLVPRLSNSNRLDQCVGVI